MHRSAIALALGLSASVATWPILAGKETQFEFSYVTQENCVWAPGFTPDFDVLNFANIGYSDYHGIITFDSSNHKAQMTVEGTFQVAPPPPPCCDIPPAGQGQPSGIYPVSFFVSPHACSFSFKLSPDLSFVLESDAAGCSTVALNGLNVGFGGTVFDINLVGQFAPDMQSLIAGHAGLNQQQQPIVQTQRFNNGFEQKRICTSMMHAVRVAGPKHHDDH